MRQHLVIGQFRIAFQQDFQIVQPPVKDDENGGVRLFGGGLNAHRGNEIPQQGDIALIQFKRVGEEIKTPANEIQLSVGLDGVGCAADLNCAVKVSVQPKTPHGNAIRDINAHIKIKGRGCGGAACVPINQPGAVACGEHGSGFGDVGDVGHRAATGETHRRNVDIGLAEADVAGDAPAPCGRAGESDGAIGCGLKKLALLVVQIAQADR